MKIQLRDYQLEAVKQALPLDAFGLFMEPRTGKTITALELARQWSCTSVTVICPKKALPVWNKEILLMGMDPSIFTVIGFEHFRINLQKYLKRCDLVIIDESHRIKERRSQQTKAAWKIGKLAKKRLILTGTPQGQGMEDYYAQLKFLRPDIFTTWGSFCDKYLIMEDQFLAGREDPFPKIVGYKNQEEFQKLLKSMSFRKTRDEVAKVRTLVRNKVLKVPVTEAFLKPYTEMENQLYIEVNEDNLISAPHILVRVMKLHQICGGFIKDEQRSVHHLHSDKLDFLWGLMDGELKGQSVAIVANFKPEMDAISKGLSERGISHVQIRGGKRHQYDPNDRSQVTIMNPSAGEAINLAHHTVMVIYSMNYSFLKWAQFKDRIVLVDTPEVKYYYLVMAGTVDEVIYQAVIKKKKLADEVLSIYKRGQIG